MIAISLEQTNLLFQVLRPTSIEIGQEGNPLGGEAPIACVVYPSGWSKTGAGIVLEC